MAHNTQYIIHNKHNTHTTEKYNGTIYIRYVVLFVHAQIYIYACIHVCIYVYMEIYIDMDKWTNTGLGTGEGTRVEVYID